MCEAKNDFWLERNRCPKENLCVGAGVPERFQLETQERNLVAPQDPDLSRTLPKIKLAFGNKMVIKSDFCKPMTKKYDKREAH